MRERERERERLYDYDPSKEFFFYFQLKQFLPYRNTKIVSKLDLTYSLMVVHDLEYCIFHRNTLSSMTRVSRKTNVTYLLDKYVRLSGYATEAEGHVLKK